MTRPDGLGAGGLNLKPEWIDDNALHRLLFRRADRFGRLKVNAKVLAAEMELGYNNLTVHLRKMTEEGRLRRIGGTHNSVKTFVIADPATWRKSDAE